jgi:hypothetical protein
MNHTSGPWTVHPDKHSFVIASEESIVADVTRRDDAYLMAAAPELWSIVRAFRAVAVSLQPEDACAFVASMRRYAETVIGGVEGEIARAEAEGRRA